MSHTASLYMNRHKNDTSITNWHKQKVEFGRSTPYFTKTSTVTYVTWKQWFLVITMSASFCNQVILLSWSHAMWVTWTHYCNSNTAENKHWLCVMTRRKSVDEIKGCAQVFATYKKIFLCWMLLTEAMRYLAIH